MARDAGRKMKKRTPFSFAGGAGANRQLGGCHECQLPGRAACFFVCSRSVTFKILRFVLRISVLNAYLCKE